MKTMLFLFMSMTLILTGCKTQKDPAVKAAIEAEEQMEFDMAVKALNERDFVLEADRITFKYGRYAYVTPNTNFISMSGDKATIQLAFNSPYAGPNGIGGITVDGTASNVKIQTDKKGNITYSMAVLGSGVSATVTFRMAQGSNKCTATVNPNFRSNPITFSGILYPKSESSVFKGTLF